MNAIGHWHPDNMRQRLAWLRKHQPKNSVAIKALERRLGADDKHGNGVLPKGSDHSLGDKRTQPGLPRSRRSVSTSGVSTQPSPKAAELRLLWQSNPSRTLFDTACRLGLGTIEAEALVVGLTASGIVRYVPCESGLRAVFN